MISEVWDALVHVTKGHCLILVFSFMYSKTSNVNRTFNILLPMLEYRVDTHACRTRHTKRQESEFGRMGMLGRVAGLN